MWDSPWSPSQTLGCHATLPQRDLEGGTLRGRLDFPKLYQSCEYSRLSLAPVTTCETRTPCSGCECTSCHVVSIWHLVSPRRLDSNFTEDCTAAIFWDMGNLHGISYLFPGAFGFQGKDKSFSIFTGSLRALTFQFYRGRLKICHERRPRLCVHSCS